MKHSKAHAEQFNCNKDTSVASHEIHAPSAITKVIFETPKIFVSTSHSQSQIPNQWVSSDGLSWAHSICMSQLWPIQWTDEDEKVTTHRTQSSDVPGTRARTGSCANTPLTARSSHS